MVGVWVEVLDAAVVVETVVDVTEAEVALVVVNVEVELTLVVVVVVVVVVTDGAAAPTMVADPWLQA